MRCPLGCPAFSFTSGILATEFAISKACFPKCSSNLVTMVRSIIIPTINNIVKISIISNKKRFNVEFCGQEIFIM